MIERGGRWSANKINDRILSRFESLFTNSILPSLQWRRHTCGSDEGRPTFDARRSGSGGSPRRRGNRHILHTPLNLALFASAGVSLNPGLRVDTELYLVDMQDDTGGAVLQIG